MSLHFLFILFSVLDCVVVRFYFQLGIWIASHCVHLSTPATTFFRNDFHPLLRFGALAYSGGEARTWSHQNIGWSCWKVINNHWY
jgi:hypothetical protein